MYMYCHSAPSTAFGFSFPFFSAFSFFCFFSIGFSSFAFSGLTSACSVTSASTFSCSMKDVPCALPGRITCFTEKKKKKSQHGQFQFSDRTVTKEKMQNMHRKL